MLYKKDIVKVNAYKRSNNNTNAGEIPHILVHNGNRLKSNIIYGIVL